MRVLAWDIGGANVKRLYLDSSTGQLASDIFYFPVWRRKQGLKDFLKTKNLEADIVGVTMTAELCDVFETREEGVKYIVGVCGEVFGDPLYLTVDGRLLRGGEIKDYLLLAASNWAASVRYLQGRYGRGVLLDVGSTTTDIFPFGYPGAEEPWGMSDLERLRKGLLVYTGFLRTPVGSIARRVPFKGGLARISAETFAITADVYNVLGMLDNYRCAPPDGGGITPRDSMRRLARMLCSDMREVGEKEIREMCAYLYQRQAAEVAGALKGVLLAYGVTEPTVYVCGSGIPLGLRACEIAGLPAVNLAEATPAYDNLPCLGMAEMLIGKV
jgi:hypothetical protein